MSPEQTVATKISLEESVTSTLVPTKECLKLSVVGEKYWEGLSKTGLSFFEMVSELVNNSIQQVCGTTINVTITIAYSLKSRDKAYIEVSDDGKGIPYDILKDVLSPSEMAGRHGVGLHEHGMGLKHSVQGMGRLHYIVTKTKDGCALRVEGPFNETMWVERLENDDSIPRGTTVRINHIREVVPQKKERFTRYLAKQLGAKYRLYLMRNNDWADLNLMLRLINLDNNTEDTLTIHPQMPTYMHRKTQKLECDHHFTLTNENAEEPWVASVTIGIAPPVKMHDTLGLSKDDPVRGYYNGPDCKNGVDIFMHGIVICFGQASEIGIQTSSINNYMKIRGELHLKKGFKTSTAKNQIIQDDNFNELKEQIAAYLKKLKYLEKDNFHEDGLEGQFRDQLENILKTFFGEDSVKKEKNTVIGTRMDLVCNDIIYEIKALPADAQDVLQTFGYSLTHSPGATLDAQLVAPGFKNTAIEMRDLLKDRFGVKIELVPFSKYNFVVDK